MCRPKEPTARDGTVTGWLRSDTFLVSVPGVGQISAVDRTGRAQPGRTVTVARVGAAWRIV